MSLRLICGDGNEVRLPKRCSEKMSLFRNYASWKNSAYTLQCKARSQIVNHLLDWLDGESEQVNITQDNFTELQSLCHELGFSGLDKQFHALETEFNIERKDLEELVNDIARQNKAILKALETHQSFFLRWQYLEERVRTLEEVTQRTATELKESITQKVKEVARVCEKNNLQLSQKTEQALGDCATRKDLEALAHELNQLKEREKTMRAEFSAAKSIHFTRKREFAYDKSKPLEGIIDYLTDKYEGNVHDNRIVNVTANFIHPDRSDDRSDDSNSQPKNVVDLGTDSEYFNDGEREMWICYKFKTSRVIPTSYSVRSCRDAPGGCHLKSWVVEVSNNGAKDSWTEIDRHEDNYDLNSEFAIANFQIPRVPSKCVKFIRLRQIGPSHQGDNSVALTSWEIFGTLYEQ